MEDQAARERTSGWKSRPLWLRRLVWTGGIGVVLYLLFGIFVLPRIVERQIVSNTQAQLGLEPTMAEVRFDPIRLRLTIEEFALSEDQAEAPLLAFESMAVDLRALDFLLADAGFDEIRLVRPHVSLVVEESGELAVARLLRTAPARAETDPEAGDEDPGSDQEDTAEEDALALELGALRIEDGSFAFTDRSIHPVFAASLSSLDLAIDGFTTRGESWAPSNLDVTVGDGTLLRWEGTLAANPIRSRGQLEIAGFDLHLPWEWANERLGFEVRQGRLALAARYELDLADGLRLSVEEGALELDGLQLVDREGEEDLLSLPSLGAVGIAVDVGASGLERLAVDSIEARRGEVSVRIGADGALQLARAFAPRTPPGEGINVAAVADAGAAAEEGAPSSPVAPASSDSGAASETPPPEITVEEIALRGFEIRYEDRSAPDPVELRVAPLDVEIGGYRNEPGSRIDLGVAAGLGEQGQLEMRGPVRIEPLDARLAVEAREIALADFQPLVDQALDLEIAEGVLSGRLDVGLALDEPDGAPSVTAKGDLRIDRLQTADRVLERDFLGWKALRLEGIDLAPGGLQLQKVGIDGASVAFVVAADGGTNAAAILAPSSGEDEAEGARESTGEGAVSDSFGISIGQIALEDSVVRLDDLSVDPVVGIELGALSGRVDGLSSSPESRAKIDLEGNVNRRAPIHLSGEINPLAMNAGGAFVLTARGIPLSDLSGYSGRYVGYAIDRGGLDLDLDYELDGPELSARNHIVLDRIELGQLVGERSTVSMSLPLALVVMRDDAKRIDLDLPVRGNIDDPDFRVLSVLGRTMTNLIVKAATSPLALLPVGGGGDPSRIAFAAGSEVLRDSEIESLEIVGRLLSDEPGLLIEVEGQADVGLDADALRRERVEARVREQAYASLSWGERRRAGEREAFQPDGAQRLAALERLAEERLGGGLEVAADPEDSSADAGDSDAREAARTRRIEALVVGLAGREELAADALSRLAQTRAERVRDYLVAEGRIAPERVTLREVLVGDQASDGVVTTNLWLGSRSASNP